MAFKDAAKFNDIMTEVKDKINWYETKRIDQISIMAFLASGDNFKYYTTKDSIAHILGIKTDYLSTCGMFNTTKSYDLIKELIKNEYRISSKILNDEIKLSDIFSKHIYEKIKIFKSNISINLENTLFVCKYNRNKAIEYGETPRNCDYVIIKKMEDGQIMELDLVLNGKIAKPVSSRLYENELEAKYQLSKILKYQSISTLNSIIVYTSYYDESKNFYLNENQKLSKLQQLENIRLNYDCDIDLVDECIYYYEKAKNGKNVGKNNYDITQQIIDCVLSGSLITKSSLGIPYSKLSMQQISLIDAINDKIIMGNDNASNNKKYSTLEKQVDSLKEAKKALEEEKTKLQNNLNEVNKENDELNKENERSKKLIKTITNALNDYENSAQ